MKKGPSQLQRRPISSKSLFARAALIAAAAAAATPAVAQVIFNGTPTPTTYSTNQSLGQLVVNSYGNTIALSGAGRTVTFAGLAPRGSNATMNVIGTPGAGQSMFLTGQPAGFVGPWLTVNGGSLAVYDAALGLRPMAAGAGPDDYVTTPTDGRHVKLIAGATPVAINASQTFESLTFASSQTYFFDQTSHALAAGVTLTLTQGGLMKSGSNSVYVIGGTIASAAPELIIGVDENPDSFMSLKSDLVVGAGGLIKTGGGGLNLGGKITGPGNVYVRKGLVILLSDRTGEGAGRSINVETNANVSITNENQLGDYQLVLSKGGKLTFKTGTSTFTRDVTLGEGGGYVTPNSNGGGAVTLAGVVHGTYKGGSSLGILGDTTLGGGATDVRPNDFNTYGLISYSSGTIFLNKANNVTAYTGDLGVFGLFPTDKATVKWLADGQMAPTVQIATTTNSILDLNGHTDAISYLASATGQETKLGTGGSLAFVGTNRTVDALGFISGAGKVVMRGTGQNLKGPDTFTGGLVVESGVTELTNARAISGGVTLRGGTFTAFSDDAIGPASNAVIFDGGTWVLKPLTSTAHPINVLAGGGLMDSTGGPFAINAPIGGGPGTLRFTNARFDLNADVNLTGRLAPTATGIINLTATGRLLGTSGLQTAPGGSVTVNSPANVSAPDQIADTAFVYANGGVFQYANNNPAGVTENAGTLVPEAGATAVLVSNSFVGQTALTFAVGQRGPGATVNFTALNASRIFLSGQADGFVGAWATAVNAAGVGFAKHTPTDGVVPLDVADYSASVAPAAHVLLAATPATDVADISVASLSINAPAAAVNVTQQPGTTLTVSTGGVLKTGAATSTIAGGTITAPANSELVVYAYGGDTAVSSAIAGNGVSLVKAGTGKLRLTGAAANAFTGKTYVNSGTLELAKTVPNAALPTDVVINGGTLALAASEQIADTAAVTLNAGGTFSLNGYNETIANFTNNGGTFTANGGRLTVTSPHTATFGAGTVTIGAGQIIDATGLLVTGQNNFVNPGGTLNVFRTTPDGEVSGGLRFEGNAPALFVANVGSGADAVVALGGEVTVNATGVARLAAGLAGPALSRVDLRGDRVFNVNSDLEVSAKLVNGTLIKRGAALLRLNGAGVSTADVSIEAGNVEVATSGALGTGTAILNGGRLNFNAAGTAQTFTGNVAVKKDGTVALTRPLGTINGAATGDFSIGNLTIGANRLTAAGSNGGKLTFTGQTTLTGDALFDTQVPLTLAGPITQSGGTFGLTKAAGAAPLILSGSATNTFTGPTRVDVGDLELRKTAGANAIGGDLVLASGAVVRSYASHQVADAAHVSVAGGALLDFQGNAETVTSLSVSPGGIVKSGAGRIGASAGFLVAGTASITPADSLGDVNVSGLATLGNYGSTTHAVLAKGMSVTGKLDVGDNNFVVDYAGPSPLASIRAAIRSGYNAGGPHWQGGAGITSSAAAANPSLLIGYAEAADVLAIGPGGSKPYLNQTADSTTVLMRLTLGGDATLDGAVDFNDLVRLAQNYNSPASLWSAGDFNYDGQVDFNDLVLLAQNYNTGLPGAAPSSPVAGFAEDLQTAFSAVPEPLGTIWVAAAALLLRRRRRTGTA